MGLLVTFSYHLCGVLEGLDHANPIVGRDPRFPFHSSLVTQAYQKGIIVIPLQCWRNWRVITTL